MMLHKVKTPEAVPGTPVEHSSSPVAQEAVKAQELVSESSASSVCPSPATLSQRREALTSKETQWDSRESNGEVIRSRRPSGKRQLQPIQTALHPTEQGAHGGLERWLSHAAQLGHDLPETTNSAVRRGMLRHRENTL